LLVEENLAEAVFGLICTLADGATSVAVLPVTIAERLAQQSWRDPPWISPDVDLEKATSRLRGRGGREIPGSRGDWATPPAPAGGFLPTARAELFPIGHVECSPMAISGSEIRARREKRAVGVGLRKLAQWLGES